MCITDPLADMFALIMNGQCAKQNEVTFQFSKIKLAVCNVLKYEGYIENVEKLQINNRSVLKVKLKYFNATPVISSLGRVSKPGKRIYSTKTEIPTVLGGLGISIITTSAGVMSDNQARKANTGGEVICRVS